MMELVQAILDDNPALSAEFANEVFNEDSGKLLKYQKLITIHQPMNLDDLHKELGAKSRALTQSSLSTNTKFCRTDGRT